MKKIRGFTLIELMIVVAIIGILAAIAIPNFLRYQLRSKSGEAAVNLAAVRTSQITYYGSNDSYNTCETQPRLTAALDATKANWAGYTTWNDIGFRPEGRVYFSYAVNTTLPSANGGAFTATATGDIDDNNTEIQCWAIQKPDSAGGLAADTADHDTACVEVATKIEQVHKASAEGFF